MRIKSQAMSILEEAIAQAQRQVDFEREHMDEIRKTALGHLRACEVRVTYLTGHLAELRRLADEIETGVAA